MIKLIACDIDGTLVYGYNSGVVDEVFNQIRRLAGLGIRFCPTSGRQQTSLRQLFAPVADELYYICENGAVIFGPGGADNVLDKVTMDRGIALELCHDIISIPGCDIQISGQDRSYLCPKSDEIVTLMRDTVGNNVTILSSPDEMPEPIVKVAAFYPAGAEIIEPLLAPRWSKYFRTAISGDAWVDFNSTDKGDGLRRLCRSLDIPLSDVMAFGDSYNDAAMLEAAGHAYIMEGACAELLARFPNHCDRVERILAQI